MTQKIPIPIALPQSLAKNPDIAFDALKEAIAGQIDERLCHSPETIRLKTIDKMLRISDSTIVVSFIDGAIAVLQATVTDGVSAIGFLDSSVIVSTLSIRETILDESLLGHFAAKAKSAEEIRLAGVKAAALSKLSDEEIEVLREMGIG